MHGGVRAGERYTAEEDETPRSIALKLGVEVADLVALNKSRRVNDMDTHECTHANLRTTTRNWPFSVLVVHKI